jgi:hypothetical protein
MANPPSIEGAATTLQDIAHDLHAGQFDLFLLDWAGDPRSHPDIAAAMRTFAEFAHDQYQDVVALLVALSTRVKAAAAEYQQTDQEAAQNITELLTGSTYQPADQRPT